MRKKTTKISKVALYAALSIVSFIFLIPLYYTVVNSLRPVLGMPVVFPKSVELTNYYYAVTLIPFWNYLKNSLIIVAITVTMGVFLNFLYSYVFARLRARGKNIIFMLTLAQMMIPSFAVMVPQYVFFSDLGLRNSWWIYVLLCLPGDPYVIFLYRQYMRKIPKDIEEAAIIDGCGYFSIISQILFPLCKSVVAIVLFNCFVANWGDYMKPFMYFTDDKYPLALALFGAKYAFPQAPNQQLEPVVLAAALLMMLPVLVLFFFCQKQLVEGTMLGAVKG